MTAVSSTGEFTPSDVVSADVHRRLAGRPVLLLTDFDGTLADLTQHPADAVMSDAVRAELDRLASHDGATVGVVSGRRLADVRARVGHDAEFAAGLHGLEIVGPSAAFAHPALEAVAPVIAELAGVAARELSKYSGVLIEDKTCALTCHVRQATAEDGRCALEAFADLAESHIERGLLKLMPGTMTYELLPNVDWHKGRAVEWIRARVAAARGHHVPVIYLGDDRTDEDAFSALGPDDIAIGVGPRPHTHLITWRLAGPASVGRFFERLSREIVEH